MSYVSLKEFCEDISISYGTGKNWIKQEKIVPHHFEGRVPFFEAAYVKKLKKEIKTADNKLLKSRRNKNYQSGNFLYRYYVSDNSVNVKLVGRLLADIEEKKLRLKESDVRLILADCALKLYGKSRGIECTFSIEQFIRNSEMAGKIGNMIMELMGNSTLSDYSSGQLDLSSYEYEYFYDEDLLGLIYMSLRNVSGRKAMGAYYTPGTVVDKLVEGTLMKKDFRIKSREESSEVRIIDKQINDKSFLDPCCGTGNFLIKLSNYVDMRNIYGNDIDKISVMLSRINLAIRYDNEDVDFLYENITYCDFLNRYNKKDFDYIVGNPPWGVCYSNEDKKKLQEKYKCAAGKNVESYDIFLEESLKHLKKGGIISFVLPEAILNVIAHKNIREYLMENCRIEYLEYLDNKFHRVQCPSIIMTITVTGEKMSTRGITVCSEDKEFTISTDRQITSELFNFNLTDEEYRIITRLKAGEVNNIIYLKDKASFALGIVTGNNEKYISQEKNQYNEPILCGKDVFKYHVNEPVLYIDYKPSELQQTADITYYRNKEKLVYRFINRQLVFAYEDKGMLTLNSCNILIPEIKDLSVKYIMAILNSRISQFVFNKSYNSVKVLRSHIESIPIPVVSSNIQQEIELLVDKIVEETDNTKLLERYNVLDEKIAEVFGLEENEYNLIKKTLSKDNLFLCQ